MAKGNTPSGIDIPDSIAPIDVAGSAALQSGSYLNQDEEFSVDYTGVQEGFPLYPEGDYHAVIEDIKKGTSKAGNPQWEWYFKITHGELKNATVRDWTSMLPQALFKSLAHLSVLGLAKANQPAKFKKSQVVGQPVILRITHGEDQKGKPRHEVEMLLPPTQETIQYAGEFVTQTSGVPVVV
jgi:hypothetical protein